MKYDAESLVAKCLSRHGMTFEHAIKNGSLDRVGIDFRIYLEEREKMIDLQVKTSDRGITTGLILPLSNPPLETYPYLSETMLWRVSNHMKKHPNVRYILFVARICRRRPEDVIISEIWRETKRLFLLAA